MKQSRNVMFLTWLFPMEPMVRPTPDAVIEERHHGGLEKNLKPNALVCHNTVSKTLTAQQQQNTPVLAV